MIDKVRKTIEEYLMIKEGESVLCCLSGGADSVALLLCLSRLGYDIRAMHINHCLRGEESDRDERFCRELCNRLGIDLTVERIDVKGFCARSGCSTEEGARKLRYEAFERSDCDRIATAHTLSDSFETALFNLARGTAVKGLCGIPPLRGRIIRPLIGCTRAEIEEFLSEQGQDFVTDSTNLTDDYSRNRIRHAVVPALKSINPEAEQAFARTARSLHMDDFCLGKEAEDLLEKARTPNGWSTDILGSARWSVMSRAVVMILKDHGVSYDNARINEMCTLARGGVGRICLSGELYAFASGGELRIAVPDPEEEREVAVTGDCEFELCGKRISVVITDKSQLESKIHRMFTYIALDYDKIKGEILVRTRRSGDSIRLRERGCTKTLKKLFNEKIPLEKRASVLLLCDREGVLAVEGIGAAERAAVTDDTRKFLLFCIGKNIP